MGEFCNAKNDQIEELKSKIKKQEVEFVHQIYQF